MGSPALMFQAVGIVMLFFNFRRSNVDTAQLTFSGGYAAAMMLILIVCCTLPVLYFIFFAFKRKINYVAIFAAVAGFLLFGYYLNGILLNAFAPYSKLEQMGALSYSIVRSVITGLTNVAGAYFCLRLLAGRYDSIKTPISCGLGFSLFYLIIEGGANAMFRLTMANSVNEKGLQAVLETVDAAQRSSLKEQLEYMAASPLAEYYYSAAKYAAYFLIGIAMTRLLWYAIRGYRRPASWVFIPAVFLLRTFMELPIAVYASGMTENVALTSVIYCAIAVVSLLASIYVSRLWDEDEKVVAAPLNRNLL